MLRPSTTSQDTTSQDTKTPWPSRSFIARTRLLVLLLLAVTARPAFAHVKWFSEFSFADRPRTLGEALTPAFLALALFSALVIGALVFLDRRLGDVGWYRRVDAWLAARQDKSLLVMRVAAGVVLLLSWQSGAMLVPKLDVASPWIGWAQFLVACLLLFRKTVPLAGLGLIALYGWGVFRFGAFYMLDYVLYLGAGYYLAVAEACAARLRGTAVPALYLTVGFSLCWVALEKVIYPEWGLYVLDQHPQLALGFPLEFFLVGAAFVEFSLGYLLIIGLLERPMALTITVVFFLTTLVFGKIEVIGHTLIHGALIVFLLEGTGPVYEAPVTFHRRLGLRTAFASVNFVVLLAVLLSLYAYGAHREYEIHTHGQHEQSYRLPAGHKAGSVSDTSVSSLRPARPRPAGAGALPRGLPRSAPRP